MEDRIEKIRMAFERQVTALARQPSTSLCTAITKVRLRNGLTCHVEDGLGSSPWTWPRNPAVTAAVRIRECWVVPRWDRASPLAT